MIGDEKTKDKENKDDIEFKQFRMAMLRKAKKRTDEMITNAFHAVATAAKILLTAFYPAFYLVYTQKIRHMLILNEKRNSKYPKSAYDSEIYIMVATTFIGLCQPSFIVIGAEFKAWILWMVAVFMWIAQLCAALYVHIFWDVIYNDHYNENCGECTKWDRFG